MILKAMKEHESNGGVPGLVVPYPRVSRCNTEIGKNRERGWYQGDSRRIKE